MLADAVLENSVLRCGMSSAPAFLYRECQGLELWKSSHAVEERGGNILFSSANRDSGTDGLLLSRVSSWNSRVAGLLLVLFSSHMALIAEKLFWPRQLGLC